MNVLNIYRAYILRNFNKKVARTSRHRRIFNLPVEIHPPGRMPRIEQKEVLGIP